MKSPGRSDINAPFIAPFREARMTRASTKMSTTAARAFPVTTRANGNGRREVDYKAGSRILDFTHVLRMSRRN